MPFEIQNKLKNKIIDDLKFDKPLAEAWAISLVNSKFFNFN